MNVSDVLKELRERKKRLDRTIAAIEEIWRMNPEDSGAARRGRKAMPKDEREEVSKRMKAYWAAWRGKRSQSLGEGTVEAGRAAAAGAGHSGEDARN